MKKSLLILGVGIAVGVATYAIWTKLRNQKSNINSTNKKNEDFRTSATVSTPDQDVTAEDIDVFRKTSEASISERHEDAAQLIKNTVDAICKHSTTTNNELDELDRIDSDLDALMKED